MHYYHDSDRLVALHYAQQLNDLGALKIIELGEVSSPEEAKILSKFYWAVVKASVEDRDNRGHEPFENMDKSLEGLHNTFSICIGNAGYEDIWDAVVDEIDQLFRASSIAYAQYYFFNPGKTSRINVAHFMADLIANDDTWSRWKGRMPVIYNKSFPDINPPSE